MTEINNFNLIKSIITFNTEQDFYFIQILKRRKDKGNEEMSRGRTVKDSFYIYSMDDLDRIEGKIIEICKEHNARAYFRINKRNTETIALQTLRLTAEYIANKQYDKVKNAYQATTGRYPGPDKKWLLDIDDVDQIPLVREFIETSQNIDSLDFLDKKIIAQKITKIAEIPTKNGMHILVKPFNPTHFTETFSDISIHKDNPTVLYC